MPHLCSSGWWQARSAGFAAATAASTRYADGQSQVQPVVHRVFMAEEQAFGPAGSNAWMLLASGLGRLIRLTIKETRRGDRTTAGARCGGRRTRKEPQQILTISAPYRRLMFASLCGPLLLLAGCPGTAATGKAGSPAKVAPQVTAPTIAGAVAAGAVKPGTPASTTATLPAQSTAPLSAKAQQTIAQAEASYASGVANYRAKRLDAARLDFDFAVDMMLSAGLDLKAEGPAADELERLLNAINSLELQALKQGNGFSPKLEEAPLDVADNLTFAPNPELARSLKTELNVTSDLPLVINDEVAGYIGVFSQSNNFRAHMRASLQRVGKYRGLIEEVLKQEGVPQDLIYLAVAESGFQPQVVNAHSGAGGMWQFMPATGVQYGLSRNGYFDYRFDPEKSSRAYARYIKALYRQFGDWYLAMAAYNWGPGNIQKDVQKTGYADFWQLYRMGLMPAQTRAYVPQILAAVIMAKNPERYGLDKLTPSPPVIYDTVTTNYAIDLRLVADVTDVSVAELVALNPSLLRLSTPRDLSFDLHLPPGTKPLYTDRLKDIPEDRRGSWRFHVVRAGETAETIAALLHGRTTEITETNGITAQDPMAVGDELVVPVQSVASGGNPQRYTVRRGDTLLTIADRFNVSVENLRVWNHDAALRAGRSVYVAEPLRLAPSARARGRGGRGRRGRMSKKERRAAAASGGKRGRGKAASGRASKRASGRASTRGSAHSARGKSSAKAGASHAKTSHTKHKAGR